MERKHDKAQLPLLPQTFSAKPIKSKINKKISRNISLTETYNNIHFNTFAQSNKTSNVNTCKSPPQINTQSLLNKMFFSSSDKTTQLTVGSSGLDLSLSNLAKFKRLNEKQLSNRPIKTKPLTNLKLYHSNNNQTIPRPHHQKAASVFYLTKGLKTHNSMFTSNRPPNNVMNIVNNLNTNSLDQGGNNKNVEINFNKYEIKILSNKPTSNKSLNEKLKSPRHTTSPEMEEPIDEALRKERHDTKYSTKCYDNKSNQDHKEILLKTETQKKHSTKRSLIYKSSYTDNENESSDLTSSNNFICMKQPIKETKVLRLLNNTNFKAKNLAKSITLISKTKQEKEDENIENDNNKPNDSNKAITKEEKEIESCVIPKPYCFSRIEIATHECDISFHGIEKQTSTHDQDAPILNIIDENGSHEQEDGNIPSRPKNDGMNDLMADLEAKIIPQENIISPSKPKLILRLSQNEDINDLSLIIPKKDKEQRPDNPENIQNILDSSNDSSVEDIRSKNKKTSFENTIKFNGLKINGESIVNETGIASNQSTKSSLTTFQIKDYSACSFLSKRANSTLLFSPRKKSKNIDPHPLKLRRHLSPKKNKRFLKQLSKISEHHHHFTPNQPEKPKLITSLSLPNISSIKISDDLSLSPARHVSQKTLKDKLVKYMNQPETLILMKRASVIQEERSESFSSREEDKDEHIFKKGSMRSNTTNSVQFVDLKTNTIKITTDLTKCQTMTEKPYSKTFIQKLFTSIEYYRTEIEDNASEEKKDLIIKTTMCIDMKYDELEDRRKRTMTKYATETLFHSTIQRKVNIDDFITSRNEHFEEELSDELIHLNEYDYFRNIDHNYLFTYPRMLFPPLCEKYYEINLLYHLQKEKYLDTDYTGLASSFIVNFSKKRKLIKRLRTASCNSYQASQLNAPNISSVHTRKRTQLKKPHGINHFFCFRYVVNDIVLDDLDDGNDIQIQIPLKKKKSTIIRKSVRKRESKMNVLNLFKKKTTVYKKQSTSKLSFNTGRTFEDMSFQRNDTILHKRFYSRHRDTLGNEEPNVNDSLYINNLSLTRRKEELFMSPLKHSDGIRATVRKNTVITNKLLLFNKETVMSQTHEIKSRILTEMKNYVDSLFFYIKDGNYQNFKDIFLKYKVDTEIKDEKGNTFLNTAVQCDSSKITIFLLDNGANVNSQNRRLNTPLHYALCYQNYYLADILIRSGADEELKNRKGMTAWQCINSASTNI